MAGYFQHALTGSDGKHNIGFFNSTALIGLVQFLKHIVSAAKIGNEKGLKGAVSNSG